MNNSGRTIRFIFFAVASVFLLPLTNRAIAVDCQVKNPPYLHTDSVMSLVPHAYFGNSGNYSVTVENRDSFDCGMGYISVAVDRPEGWNISFDPPSPVSVKPGDTVLVKMSVNPPPSALKLRYELPAHFTNTTTGITTDLKFWYEVTDDPPASTPAPAYTPTITPTPYRPTRIPTWVPTVTPVVHLSPIVSPTPNTDSDTPAHAWGDVKVYEAPEPKQSESLLTLIIGFLRSLIGLSN